MTSEDTHRELAKQLFNDTWTLLDRTDRSETDDDLLVHTAHASRYHWAQVGGPEHAVRGEWLCSRVHAVLGRAEPALHHARRALALATDAGLGDWDLAFCHEALARAHAVAGDRAGTETHLAAARSVPIAEDDDREQLLSDLATIRIP